ncbi:MAG: hypothetical protein A2Y55_08470 [Actinobacteria bacterium RBG_16_68_12]|nr:MAG: hypothetical protein A2Y55_08470 [Actinobacteria bacterium RBG_16_68_12]
MAGCGGSESSDVVAVKGRTTCKVTARTFPSPQMVDEHFSCVVEMSDPRVSGQFEADFHTTYDGEVAGAWK